MPRKAKTDESAESDNTRVVTIRVSEATAKKILAWGSLNDPERKFSFNGLAQQVFERVVSES